MTPVIDVHTHMLSDAWVAAIKAHGGPKYAIGAARGGGEAVFLDGAPFMTLMPGMFDYAMRIRAMDEAGVDIAIVSLTCPNVFWGGRTVSLDTARAVNDDMAAAQARYPARIRWLANLPWQHAADAVAELRRAHGNGAVGVMTLGNIAGAHLTDAQFTPIWRAIEALDLPVLVHPTVPQGAAAMAMDAYNLVANIGFMFDTTLAFTRMIYDGFLDRHPGLKLIAAHAGATLPYIAGRLDRCHEMMPACRANISAPPSHYLRQLYYDTVTYTAEALTTCLAVAGADRLLYGSDYPHNIGDMRGCLARVDALPAAERDAARGGNAARIFGL
jgi:aminocarboxymuconate-semialdehyde decarboxylase